MKTQPIPRPGSHRTNHKSLLRIVAFVALVALIAIPLFSSSSASSSHRGLGVGTASTPTVETVSDRMLLKQESVRISSEVFRSHFPPSPILSLMLPQAASESIATFEFPDCTVPKDSFNLGETVCAKVTGAPLGTMDRAARRIAWVSPYGSLAQGAEITTDPQTGSYQIPNSPTQTFTDDGGGMVTVDNRGTWKVSITSASDGSVRESAGFTVHDPIKAFVDLSINQAVTTSEAQVGAGSGSVFELFVTNRGPEAATQVVLTDVFSDIVTFTSAVEAPGGPGFVCGTPDGNNFNCTLASMPAGSTAHISFAYMVSEGTPEGSIITNSASISSSQTPCSPDPTCELQPDDNSSIATAQVPTPAGVQTCSLNCHENMSVLANTTQMGNPGALVSFGAASGAGNCGALTATPSSGSFFPVGTTVVEVTSETGEGSCSFTVTVVEGTPPTISCPANITVTAAANATSATVNPGTPVTNPATDVTVFGIRSDDPICTEGDDPGCDAVPVTDPYPLGTTTIAWTVTDANGLSASCTQRITVNENNCGGDTEAPTITAPPDVTIGSGPGATSCGVALDDELGLAEATDACSVSISTTGIPANNFFPLGATTITYTATDGAGNTASDTQIVTVFDDTPPVIAAPADAAYTCLSEVPAASPSQATRGTVLDEDGNPLPPGPPFDNCGTPAVTVGETSSGAGSAASPRIITRTFTATDNNGNSASAVQTITVIDPTPPTFTSVPGDVIAYTGAGAVSCGSIVSDATLGTATAQDNCSVVVTRSGVPAGNAFPLGNTIVTYTATDGGGNTATATQTVTVIDNTPPTITCPSNITTGTDQDTCSASVNPGTATATDNCDSSPTITGTRSDGQPLNAPYPQGITSITWTATDDDGNSSSCTQTVTVTDDQNPTIVLNGYAPSLWPPNHNYHTFQVTSFVTGVNDNCGPISVSNVVIAQVTSDESENGNGDGNTNDDIVIAADCKSVQLRAERQGSGNGRVYTILFRVRDATGNTSTATAKVVVPKNPNQTPVDSGPHYTVTGNCP